MVLRLAITTITVAAAVLCVTPAKAEPYLAVFKGMQCSACHTQPAGGGKRSTYGNVYAQSELPANRAGAADAGLWTGELTRFLSTGADVRADYKYTDVPNIDSASEFDIQRATLYLEATLVPNRLAVYIDQQLAPGASLNREAYVKLRSQDGHWHLIAGQFFLPYGIRLQDDSAFIREYTGVNFFSSDRGVQFGYEHGPWSAQLSVTNGSAGGAEFDNEKQVSFVGQFVTESWRAGLSYNRNNTDAGDRQMQNVFAGFKTGNLVWLAEIDLIFDDIPGTGRQDSIAGLLEGNWLFRKGHNIKVSYDYIDPNESTGDDQQVRWSLVWEYTPIQFLQNRLGARIYDGIPQSDQQNRNEYFIEIHGFF